MGNFDSDKIDQLFSGHLADAVYDAPESAWEKISAEMEKDRLKRKVFFARMTAAASILLVLGLGTWMFVRDFGSAAPQYWTGNVITLPGTANSGNLSPAPATFQAVNPSAGNASAGVALQTAPAPSPAHAQQTPVRLAASTNSSVDLRNLFIDQFGPVKGQSVALPSLDAPRRSPADIPVQETSSSYDEALLAARVREMIAENPELTTAVQEDARAIVLEDLGKPDDGSQSKRKTKWNLGGAFSPDYTLAFQSPVQDQVNTRTRSLKLQDPVEAEKETTDFVTAFSTGMQVGVDLSDRLSLQSGLMYSRRTSSDASQLDTFDKVESFNSEFNLNLLEIPVTMRYNLISKDNFNYYLASGLSTHLLWNYQNTLTDEEGAVNARVISDDQSTLRPSQANLLLSTGVRYNLLDKLSMNLEPGIRYGFLNSKYSFNQNNGVTFSLSSGINYHF